MRLPWAVLLLALLACRYVFWRCTATLNLDSPLAAALSLLLLASAHALRTRSPRVSQTAAGTVFLLGFLGILGHAAFAVFVVGCRPFQKFQPVRRRAINTTVLSRLGECPFCRTRVTAFHLHLTE